MRTFSFRQSDLHSRREIKADEYSVKQGIIQFLRNAETGAEREVVFEGAIGGLWEVELKEESRE